MVRYLANKELIKNNDNKIIIVVIIYHQTYVDNTRHRMKEKRAFHSMDNISNLLATTVDRARFVF